MTTAFRFHNLQIILTIGCPLILQTVQHSLVNLDTMPTIFALKKPRPYKY